MRPIAAHTVRPGTPETLRPTEVPQLELSSGYFAPFEPLVHSVKAAFPTTFAAGQEVTGDACPATM